MSERVFLKGMEKEVSPVDVFCAELCFFLNGILFIVALFVLAIFQIVAQKELHGGVHNRRVRMMNR